MQTGTRPPTLEEMHDAAEQDAGWGSPRPADYSSMISALGAELPRRSIALALGVNPRQLDEIEAGVVPDDAVAKRLCFLHDLDGKADLRDPSSIVRALNAEGARIPESPLRLFALPGLRPLLIAFLAIDAVVVAFVLSRL